MIALLIVVWSLRTLASIPHATYYWQLKEYRWDRMREFLVQQHGHQHFFSSFHLLLGLLLVTGFFFLYLPTGETFFSPFFAPAVIIILLAELLEVGHRFWQKKWRRPRLTVKALLIMGLTAGLEVLALALLLYRSQFSPPTNVLAAVLAFLVLVDHDVNGFCVFLVNAVTNVFKRRLYQRARRKRLQFKKLRVVGITGSYGKTSVKEFLSHILEQKYKLLKTPKNTNTEVGIAQTILNDLKPEHEVFVCEMGAYKMGEIKLCCMMARPQTAIFTGLNDQHVALFGSVNNTFRAKWELVSSLPADGVAFFNGDAPELRSRIKPFKGKAVVCSTQRGDVRAENIEVSSNSIAFQYQGQAFTAPLVGGFQVMNVLLAIAAAEQLGMNLPQIAKRVSTLQAPEKTMQLTAVKGGLIMDDSYNVNSDGLHAALEHLKLFSDHLKIIFFPGILELGEESEKRHEQLGQDVGQHVDFAFFTDDNFSGALQRGALQGGLTRSHIMTKQDPE